jgi:hypothetical protein
MRVVRQQLKERPTDAVRRVELKQSALVRWTGRGRIDELAESVARVLRAAGLRARTRVLGGSIVVSGPRPTDVALLLRNLPGVSWVAAGFSFSSPGELADSTSRLARAYLKRGGSFATWAESTHGGARAGDLTGMVNSAVIDAVGGARVEGRKPDVRFRVARDRLGGAVGVQLAEGAGGRAVGAERVHVLVSGGKHSSVLAWTALLSGKGVEMVHVDAGHESLLGVARLYSELSNRADHTKLSLTVIRGAEVGRAVRWWLEREGRELYGGWHAECHERVPEHRGRLFAPVYFLPEEFFDRTLAELSLSDAGERASWPEGEPAGRVRVLRFGGRRADVHDVMDSLA